MSSWAQEPLPASVNPHLNVKSQDMKWERIFPELGERSSEISILHTDPVTHATQLMIRVPENFHVPKHWHTANETHTIISGIFVMEAEGMREVLGPGSFNYMPSKMHHEAWTRQDEGALLFITVDGAWDINWVNGPPKASNLIGGLRERPRSDPADVSALNHLQKQVDSAIIAGDTERYLTFLTDDAVLMPPNGPAVTGKDAIRSWNQAMSRAFRIQEYASRNDEVIVAGEWAFRRAAIDWTLTATSGAQAVRDRGKFIIIYRRQGDGSWKVARDIWNSDTGTR
jgi:ketosteroid isomerase-like protein/mannose-6-phosphate isomerase-like protein (cupin superfamily)